MAITIRKAELRFKRVVAPGPENIYDVNITGPHIAALIARRLYGNSEQEVFVVFFLDVKNQLTGYMEVARGGQSSCNVDVRILFRAALLSGADAILVIHNHPSGNPEPSDADVMLTSRLRAAADLVGVPILDHVIVTDNSQCSFREAGLW